MVLRQTLTGDYFAVCCRLQSSLLSISMLQLACNPVTGGSSFTLLDNFLDSSRDESWNDSRFYQSHGRQSNRDRASQTSDL